MGLAVTEHLGGSRISQGKVSTLEPGGTNCMSAVVVFIQWVFAFHIDHFRGPFSNKLIFINHYSISRIIMCVIKAILSSNSNFTEAFSYSAYCNYSKACELF